FQNANAVSNQRLFSSLLLMRKLMLRSPDLKSEADAWRDRVTQLLKNLPSAPNAHGRMGLIAGWQSHPVWR
ncbi:MAG: hypothetical protein ACK5N9_10605, partial [Pirellula sp.]